MLLLITFMKDMSQSSINNNENATKVKLDDDVKEISLQKTKNKKDNSIDIK